MLRKKEVMQGGERKYMSLQWKLNNFRDSGREMGMEIRAGLIYESATYKKF